jgi:hypothetical protein
MVGSARYVRLLRVMNGLALLDAVFAEAEADESPMLPSAEDEGRLSLEAMISVHLSRGIADDDNEKFPFLSRGRGYCCAKACPGSSRSVARSSWRAWVFSLDFRDAGDEESALASSIGDGGAR